MDAKEIKSFILEDVEGRLFPILEEFNYHKIKNHGKYVTCAVEGYNNANGFIVKLNQSLTCTGYTTNSGFESGDIINLVQYHVGLDENDFVGALRWLHNFLGIPYITYINDTPRRNIFTDHLKRVKVDRTKLSTRELKPYTQADIDKLDPLYMPLYEWLEKDCISPKAMDEFGCFLSYTYGRYCIPHYYWKDGSLVGVFGRILKTQQEIDLFDLKKYLGVLPYDKGMNLFGYWQNKDHIKQADKVVVLESEKAIMQLYTKGVRNCVSICCHDFTEEQIRILTGLRKDIVIAFDEDVKMNLLVKQANKFKNSQVKIYFMYDELGLLKEKESPADKHRLIWNYLYNNLYEYDMKKGVIISPLHGETTLEDWGIEDA